MAVNHVTSGNTGVMAKLVRRLSDAEVEAYNHIEPALARRVRLVRIPLIPGGFSGMTLGTWILVAVPVPDDGRSTLVAHELVHVRQWNEGRIRFTRRYLGSFLQQLRVERAWKAAYWLIEAEREARDETHRWQQQMTPESRTGENQ